VKHRCGQLYILAYVCGLCLCVGHDCQACKMAEPIEMAFGVFWTQETIIDGLCGCHLVNTIERSMLTGNAAYYCHYYGNLFGFVFNSSVFIAVCRRLQRYLSVYMSYVIVIQCVLRLCEFVVSCAKCWHRNSASISSAAVLLGGGHWRPRPTSLSYAPK